jgi:hypothetical protein
MELPIVLNVSPEFDALEGHVFFAELDVLHLRGSVHRPEAGLPITFHRAIFLDVILAYHTRALAEYQDLPNVLGTQRLLVRFGNRSTQRRRRSTQQEDSRDGEEQQG